MRVIRPLLIGFAFLVSFAVVLMIIRVEPWAYKFALCLLNGHEPVEIDLTKDFTIREIVWYKGDDKKFATYGCVRCHLVYWRVMAK